MTTDESDRGGLRLTGNMTAGVSAQGYVVAGLVSLVVSALIAGLVALVLSACFPSAPRRAAQPAPGGAAATPARGRRMGARVLGGRLPYGLSAVVALVAAVALVAVVAALVDGGSSARLGVASQSPPVAAEPEVPEEPTTVPAPVAPAPASPPRTVPPTSTPADAEPPEPSSSVPDPTAVDVVAPTPPPSLPQFRPAPTTTTPRSPVTTRRAPPTTRSSPTTTIASRELRLPGLSGQG